MYFNSLSEIKLYVENTEIKANEQLMILVGDKSSEELQELRDYLNKKSVKYFGGIFPKLLVRNKCLSNGFIVNKVEPVYCSLVLPFLMRFKANLEADQNYTAVVLVDGLSNKMKELTDTLYNKLENKVTYIGGGAGFYDLNHRPCIFDNNGVYEDVLYVCILKSNVELAVKHGWNKLEGPYTATEANGNTLSRLGNYGAFEVYKDVIEDEERITLYKEDFFVYAKDHPFGIQERGEQDVIVRDPIKLTDNYEIVCIADIPLDSELYILKGDINTLLQSSKEIAEYCSSKAPSKYKPMLFDCISRAMFMEERFEEELYNIQNMLSYSVEGALSIGEIASKSNGEIVIHNKSTILGLVENI